MTPLDNQEAGSVAALAGPQDAKAASPALPCNSIEQLTPEEKASGEVELDAMSEATDAVGGGKDIADAVSIDGADLFERIHVFLRRFVSYPSPESSIAHALWIGHTHLMDAWFSTPRLAFISPEPGSGKSRALEITAIMVPRPELTVGSSAAFVSRALADVANRPTILLDEIDTVFGPLARSNEDLRGVINSGYRKGASVGRCAKVKDNYVTVRLPTYGAIALGGLGDLPDTIMSRSVVIPMRKRGPGETTEAFRPILHEPEGVALREELERWAETVLERAEGFEPVMPAGISDRNADVWSPLLTVAEFAGGRWPDMAREAAVAFVDIMKASGRPTLGVQLLADIRSCFHEHQLPTQELLDRLLIDEEAPWGDLKGKRLDPRMLAELVRQYGIRSTGLRMGGSTPKGYKRVAFYDAWSRYLPVSAGSATSATTATGREDPQETGGSSAADKASPPPCGGRGSDVAEAESP